jgi:hypothetical protein
VSLVVACLTSKFSKGNSRSLADDLVTGQGDVFSRAASTLRSVESQPLVGRLVSPSLMSLHRSPNAFAVAPPPPPPPTIIVTSTICNILRNLSPPPSILRPSSLFCAIHKTVEPFASSNLSKIYASENGRILHKSAPHFHLSSIIPNMFFFSANTISHSQNETIQK